MIIKTNSLLSTMDVAKRMGVHQVSVVRWIQQGDLHAYDVSRGNKPVYKVAEKDLLAWERTRKELPGA